jgi:hypothetical protein
MPSQFVATFDAMNPLIYAVLGSVFGKKATAIVVIVAMIAIVKINAENPLALTNGPSAQTASEEIPKLTASRTPATRERMLSSTKRAMIASVNGIAPNTNTMHSVTKTKNHQPCAWMRDRGNRVDNCEHDADRCRIGRNRARAFAQKLCIAVGGEIENDAPERGGDGEHCEHTHRCASIDLQRPTFFLRR